MDDPKTKFTREKLADAIHIWNRSAITLLDIRHNLITHEDALINYRLPASTFLYTRGEKAEVCLDSTFYNMERFGLFHSYKGAELTITPQCKWLEYYLVLYKAEEPPFHKGEFSKLLARTNPFRQLYGFLPSNPLFFAEQLRKMYEKWKGPTPLNLFYGKTTFYQLVYEIYEELEQGNIQVLEPDIVAIAKRYLDKHYQDEIVIQELCDSLGISYSHFHRNFKQQTGKSPQEYLIKVRLSAAMEALESGDSSIREVAAYCGFPDEINFYRQFIKHLGIAPSAYRQTSQHHMRDGAMESTHPFSYNWDKTVSYNEPEEKGVSFMLKQMRSKTIVAAALSLMLLMGACGTAPSNGNGVESAPTSAIISAATEAEVTAPPQAETRVISTIMGDVEVPMNPQRVLVNFYTGDVLAFGVTPVAIDKDFKLSYATYADLVSDIPQVSFWSSPEDLMEWEPDVIILAGAGGDGYYEKVSKIAPVIVCPSNLRERITLLGKVFDMEDKAEQLLQDYESKVEATKEKIGNLGFADKTFSIVEATQDRGATVLFFYDDNGRGGEIIYTDLGLSAPERLVEEYPEYSMTVSMEVAAQYMGDFILYSRTTDDFDYSTIQIWNSIPAVKNGNVFEFDGNSFYQHDIISTNNQLDIIQEALVNLSRQ